ncbi:Uncharacterised protein [Candidatus Burarchaeum australiense]|nr:Uncharacterised protein [Candidatus Burarchaeum australiense]
MDENAGNLGLENKKNELIERAKQLDRIIYGKSCEKKALESVLGGKMQGTSAGRLREDVEALEFKIATEAYTLDKERALLKDIKKKKEQLAEAVDTSRKYSRLRYLGEGIVILQKQREDLEKEIQTAKAEIIKTRRKEEGQHFKQEKTRKVVEKHEQYKKEMEQYRGAKPESLELGDIAVIRRKKEGEG